MDVRASSGTRLRLKTRTTKGDIARISFFLMTFQFISWIALYFVSIYDISLFILIMSAVQMGFSTIFLFTGWMMDFSGSSSGPKSVLISTYFEIIKEDNTDARRSI